MFPGFIKTLFGVSLFSEEQDNVLEIQLEPKPLKSDIDEPALFDWDAERIYDQPNVIPFRREFAEGDTVLDPRD
jgi:hypothetical protein